MMCQPNPAAQSQQQQQGQYPESPEFLFREPRLHRPSRFPMRLSCYTATKLTNFLGIITVFLMVFPSKYGRTLSLANARASRS